MKPEDFEPIANSSALPEQYAAFKKRQAEERRIEQSEQAIIATALRTTNSTPG